VSISNRSDRSSFEIPQVVIDFAQKIFFIGLVVSLGILGYLIYGLMTGQLADAAAGQKGVAALAEHQHALQLVTSLSQYLNISMIVTVIAACILFYDVETAGIIMLVLAAVMAYGLQFANDFLFASDAAKLVKGDLSNMTVQAIQSTAGIIGVPGVLLFLRSLFLRITDGRRGPDLTAMQYGQGAKKEKVPRALLAATAKCWQLPFCREGIRVKCPIYLGRTKCWKERVGCMCEENIILLATGGEERKAVDMTKEVGFVAIGDLISKSDAEKRTSMTTRQGPRGVRIPTNPHLSDAQKRDRCRNCIIYNEHQRQKYQMLAPLVTLAVPALVFLEFDSIRVWLAQAMHSLDAMIANIKFAPTGPSSAISNEVSSSLFIQGAIILCLTLMVMTWALRLLEFCTFKIKI
jgi:hypothetical protein